MTLLHTFLLAVGVYAAICGVTNALLVVVPDNYRDNDTPRWLSLLIMFGDLWIIGAAIQLWGMYP